MAYPPRQHGDRDGRTRAEQARAESREQHDAEQTLEKPREVARDADRARFEQYEEQQRLKDHRPYIEALIERKALAAHNRSGHVGRR